LFLLSGDLRRTIHASPLSLADIAARVQIPVLTLDEFLTGERTLRSDVLDRLAGSMGLELVARG
jgi:transcriptional regulator with XRE-family HTH domain